MDLQPLTSGNTSSIIRKGSNFENFQVNQVGGFIIIFFDSNIDITQLNPDIPIESKELFETEKKYFQELIKQQGFIKKNKGKYIAIKSCEVLGIESSFSKLSKDVFKDKNNINKVFIKKISNKEEFTHISSPIY